MDQRIVSTIGEMDSERYAEIRDVRKPRGGDSYLGGQEKEWMGCLLDDLRSFGIEIDQ